MAATEPRPRSLDEILADVEALADKLDETEHRTDELENLGAALAERVDKIEAAINIEEDHGTPKARPRRWRRH